MEFINPVERRENAKNKNNEVEAIKEILIEEKITTKTKLKNRINRRNERK